MAAKHEGIALLSMYNDEEDDEVVEGIPGDGYDGEADGGFDNGGALPPTESSIFDTTPILQSRTPPSFDEYADSKTQIGRIQQWSPRRPPTPPLPSLFETLDPPRTRIGTLAIVDYAHDEAAMSPEPEEGEILSVGEAMVGVEIQVSDGYFEETVVPGSINILSSAQAEHNYPSDLPEQFNSETIAMDFTGLESEIAPAEPASTVYEETREDDPLTNFLPPPTTKKCPEELQEKFNKFLAYKKAGKSFNADLRNRKDYRNPDFLQHAVTYQEIDQIGTCFSKDVFDPHGYDKSDYYDELEADMKREIEKKEQERKRSPKVDFISGGTQPATVCPAPKISTQIPAGAGGGLQSVSNAADAVTNRQNKKTKWDKVDSDAKVPLQSGGNDNLLSVTNAGTGYTAFAQQKRREAEEKKSNLRKLEENS